MSSSKKHTLADYYLQNAPVHLKETIVDGYMEKANSFRVRYYEEENEDEAEKIFRKLYFLYKRFDQQYRHGYG